MNLATERVVLLAPTVTTASGVTPSINLSRYMESTLMIDVTAITGVGANVVVSHQYSHDNVEWYLAPVAEDLTGITGVTHLAVCLANKAASWYRTAFTLTGTTPQMTLEFVLTGKVYT